MNADEPRDYLNRRKVKYEEEKVQHGAQFRCAEGEIFTVYKTGKISFQGKQTEPAKEVRQRLTCDA